MEEKEEQIKKYQEELNSFERKNEQQKSQINNLIEKVTNLVDDNIKSSNEKSVIIQKEEGHLEKVSQLSEIIDTLKEEKESLSSEHNSMKDLYFTFLETCHNIINPDLGIQDDFDIEFIQNGILNKLKEIQHSIFDYETQRKEDQDTIEGMQSHIDELIENLNHISTKKTHSKIVQTEIFDLGQESSLHFLSKNSGHARSTTSLVYSEDDNDEFSHTGSRKDLKTAYQHDRNYYNLNDNQENVNKNTMQKIKYDMDQLSSIDHDQVSAQKYNSLKFQNHQIYSELQELKQHNFELSNKLSDIQSQNSEKLKIEKLADMVESQKDQIKELQKTLESVKDQNEKLKKQNEERQNDRSGVFNNDLLQSQFSCSLGLSKPTPQDYAQIESLIHRTNPIMVQEQSSIHESFLVNSTNQVLNTGKDESNCKLKPSDLEMSQRSQVKRTLNSDLQEDNEGKHDIDDSRAIMLERENMQLRHSIENLENSIQAVTDRYNQLMAKHLEEKETLNDKITSIVYQFSQEKNELLTKLKMADNTSLVASLETRLESKNIKISQLTDKISELRSEIDSEISNYKMQIKELTKKNLEVKTNFEDQQEEVDKMSGILLEKQTQLEILSESLQNVRDSSSEDLLQKYLTQNAELCYYQALNAKFEKQIQDVYKKWYSKKGECHELKQQVEELNENLEENRLAYETLVKEIEQYNEFTQERSVKSQKSEEARYISN